MDKDQVFKNPDKVWRYLRAQGYKVSRAVCYLAAKDGRLMLEADGGVLLSSVERFIALAGLTKPAADSVDAGLRADEKAREEIAHLRAKRQLTEFNLEREQGRYMLKSDFGREVAARAGVLEQGLKNLFRTRMVDLIHMVGGDQAKLQTAQDWLVMELDALLTEYASVERFHVIFESEETDA